MIDTFSSVVSVFRSVEVSLYFEKHVRDLFFDLNVGERRPAHIYAFPRTVRRNSLFHPHPPASPSSLDPIVVTRCCPMITVQRRRLAHRTRRRTQVKRFANSVDQRGRVFDHYSGGSQRFSERSIAVHNITAEKSRPIFDV